MKIFKVKIETLISLALGLFAVLVVQIAANQERLSGINDLKTRNLYAGYVNAEYQDYTTITPSVFYPGFP
jgi:hypothetical protein